MNIKSKILSFSLAAATMVSMIGATGAVTASAATAPGDVTNIKGSYKQRSVNYKSGDIYNNARFGVQLTWSPVADAEKYYIYKCQLQPSGKWVFYPNKPFGQITGTKCYINGITPGGSRCYVIKAYKNGLYSKKNSAIKFNFSPNIQLNVEKQDATNTSCVAASLAWVANYVKNTTSYTPANVYQQAKQWGYIEANNGINQEKVSELATKLGLKGVYGTSYDCGNYDDVEATNKYLKAVLDTQLKNNNPVIIMGVFSASNVYQNEEHAVVVVGKDFATGTYKIADPGYANKNQRGSWDGTMIRLGLSEYNTNDTYTSKSDFSINRMYVSYYYVNK